jgi:hypothetical protein
VLESAQLLTQKKEGRVRRYFINEERLGVVEDWLGWFKNKADSQSRDPDLPERTMQAQSLSASAASAAGLTTAPRGKRALKVLK